MKEALHAARCYYYRFVRFPSYRARGFQIVNPYCKYWTRFPQSSMKESLQEVLERIETKRLGSLLELGCGDGTHYSAMLRDFADSIYGVDILNPEQVKNVDHYVQANSNPDQDFAVMPDHSVDAVLSFSFVGMRHTLDWTEYISDPSTRQGRYFTAEFLRILKPGGHVITIEWEAYPEKRFGKSPLNGVHENIETFYPAPENFNGLRKAAQGITSNFNPYIVYRKES